MNKNNQKNEIQIFHETKDFSRLTDQFFSENDIKSKIRSLETLL